MVAVPGLIPLTVPLLTVATDVLELVQVTFLFVAVDGAIVALSVSLVPTVNDNVVLFNVTPVTPLFLLITTLNALVVALLPALSSTVNV